MRRQFLRRRKAWLLALVAILAIIAAVFYQRSLPAQAESLYTVALDRGDIEKVVLASGTIKPAVQVSVGAQSWLPRPRWYSTAKRWRASRRCSAMVRE